MNDTQANDIANATITGVLFDLVTTVLDKFPFDEAIATVERAIERHEKGQDLPEGDTTGQDMLEILNMMKTLDGKLQAFHAQGKERMEAIKSHRAAKGATSAEQQ